MAANETANLSFRCPEAHSHHAPLYAFAIPVQIIATFAHICILYIIWKRCAKVNYLMVPQYIFLTNLSISDLVFVETLLPIYAITHETYDKCMSHLAAKEFVQVTCIIVSLSSIVALTINKYIFCKLSLRYNRIVTKRKAVTVVIAIWIISILSTGLAVLLPVVGNKHSFVSSGVLLATTCFVGGLIILVLHVHLHLISKSKVTAQQRQIEYVSNEEALEELWKRNLRKTIIVNIITISFVVFYMPQAVIFLYIHIVARCGTDCNTALIVSEITSYLGTMLDPVIYGLTIQDVRTGFRIQARHVANYFRDGFIARNSVHATTHEAHEI